MNDLESYPRVNGFQATIECTPLYFYSTFMKFPAQCTVIGSVQIPQQNNYNSLNHLTITKCGAWAPHVSVCLSSLFQKKDVRMMRFIQEVNTTTRSCALWDLEADTEYIVHVQSISMSGTSPPSDPVLFRTPKESEKMASKSPGKWMINCRHALRMP